MSSLPNHVSSDGAWDKLIEWENSSSLAPVSADFFDSDLNLAENYVPWVIEADSIEANGNFGAEGLIDFDAACNDQHPWDFSRNLTLSVSDEVHQDVTRKSDFRSNTLPEWYSGDSSVRYDPDSSKCGRAVAFSGAKINQDERNALIEIAMPTHMLVKEEEEEEEEEEAAPDDNIISPKRRKVSSSNSSNNSLADGYRAGHNAIEKRYRSNLNSKILTLEQCLPIQDISEGKEDRKPVRTTKSAILTRAINHIEFLHKNTKRLTLETESLSKRSEALHTLGLIPVREQAEILKSNENVHVEKEVRSRPKRKEKVNGALLAHQRQKKEDF